MFEVIVVGAGPAGVGISIILKKVGINFTVLERYDVGSSFLRWPEQMKLLTPSFFSNAFRMIDLNAISYDTSPALSLQTEHPSGKEYADYLKKLAEYFKLPILKGINVDSVSTTSNGFTINTNKGKMQTRLLIWSGGGISVSKSKSLSGS